MSHTSCIVTVILLTSPATSCMQASVVSGAMIKASCGWPLIVHSLGAHLPYFSSHSTTPAANFPLPSPISQEDAASVHPAPTLRLDLRTGAGRQRASRGDTCSAWPIDRSPKGRAAGPRQAAHVCSSRGPLRPPGKQQLLCRRATLLPDSCTHTGMMSAQHNNLCNLCNLCIASERIRQQAVLVVSAGRQAVPAGRFNSVSRQR